MTDRFPKSPGFTLVELVMVITIAGIVMVVAAPRFFDVGVVKSRGFFEELVGAARYAQKFAVASGCQVQLSITSNSFSLKQRSACDTSSAFDLSVPHPSKSGDFVPNETSAETISPVTDITFDALGKASATVTVTLGSRSFKIHDETGFVEVL